VIVTHLEIASPKYFIPFSLILLPKRLSFKEARVKHFGIASPNYFAVLSLIVFQLFVKLIESMN